MDQIQQQVKGAGLLRQQRLTQLQTELQPWINDWEMIGRRLAPQHGRWLNDANQRNRPRTSESIDVIDNTGTMAVQTLQNGMMSLAFSPARRFWKGTIADKDLAEWQPVSEHLAIIDDAVGTVLAMSNFYRVTHEGFAPLGVFGMNAVHLRQHPKRGMWLYPYEIGEYSVAGNEENEIDTIYRQFAMTTVQIVEQFGWAAVSDRVKTSWNHGHLGHWHTVVHAIEPRAHRKPQSLAARDMPFASIYWELSQSKTDEVLRESGYEEFPVVVPRWSTRCGEVYGYGAGTYAVGDTGALNHLGYRSSQLVDFGVEPPVQGPSAHSQDEPSFLPGSLTHNEQPGTQPFKPVWQPTLSLGELNVERMDTRQRINRAFFVDMFLMLSNISDTTQRTAAEVAKRAEEQLVQAGPVVSRINREYGEPVLKFAFKVAQQMGLIPPPPEELQGQRWEIEFDSVFVQAQKLIGTANNDRFMASIGPVLAYDQTQVDVLDGEAIIRDYASRYSIRPKNLRSPKKVAERQQSRAAAMAAKEQSAILAEQAGAASNLAGAAATGGAPADQLSQLVGYNSPPAQSY